MTERNRIIDIIAPHHMKAASEAILPVIPKGCTFVLFVTHPTCGGHVMAATVPVERAKEICDGFVATSLRAIDAIDGTRILVGQLPSADDTRELSPSQLACKFIAQRWPDMIPIVIALREDRRTIDCASELPREVLIEALKATAQSLEQRGANLERLKTGAGLSPEDRAAAAAPDE